MSLRIPPVRYLNAAPLGTRLQPEFVPHEPGVSDMLRKCDAAPIVGDAALRCLPEEFQITDLAAAWRERRKKAKVLP